MEEVPPPPPPVPLPPPPLMLEMEALFLLIRLLLRQMEQNMTQTNIDAPAIKPVSRKSETISRDLMQLASSESSYLPQL